MTDKKTSTRDDEQTEDGAHERVRTRTRERVDLTTPRPRSRERSRASGDSSDADSAPREQPDEPDRPLTGDPKLQLSWDDGDIVAWAAGPDAEVQDEERVRELLADAEAGVDHWVSHKPLPLPDGRHAPALSAPLTTTLAWLVDCADLTDDSVGASVPWMGLAANLAVRLVADGRMVPQLDHVGDARGNRSKYAVRWLPTLIDHGELTRLARAMPGAVSVTDRRRDARAMSRLIVAGMVDLVCRDAARRVEVPAPPPDPRSASEVSEAILTRLDGSTFEAPEQHAASILKNMKSWAHGVTRDAKLHLIVQLEAPDKDDAWLLRTFVGGGKGKERAEAAMSRSKHDRKEAILSELERLEELYPPLARDRSSRRGEVILSQDEAWELMTNTGKVLSSAGFDVRVPPLAPKKATPTLKVTAVGGGETAVGAQQLTAVQWSAVFDDVELTADEIQELAKQSKPLVKSHGRWVEVDHADLEAAAAALAERGKQKQMTGADLLRHALGLDGTSMGRPVGVGGSGWAVELLRSAQEIPENPSTTPDGFDGELRAYQADARAWLGFLDQAGLGGILALDMGLGKTPTMLAHLAQIKERGPALVIAPPAVVGNWHAEAQRFTPDLRVIVHHGANRAEQDEISDELEQADVLLTTYGTAVRDIDALADVSWGALVLDEGQVIKNPLSETAIQLRRLGAHHRVVLTGTPIENGLGDLWALLDFVNPGLVGDRATFVAQLGAAAEAGKRAESALSALNGVLVFRRTKAEPVIAAELPDRIDELDHCPMTAEQVGLYQAVLDELVAEQADEESDRKGAILAAITALKQVCNHPAAYTGDDGPLEGRSGKLARLQEILENVFESGERALIFTHFASWGERLAKHLTATTGQTINCYHGGLSRGARDKMVKAFQEGEGAGALVLSLKAGGTGLNLTAASHVILYDRWWNPAVEDQARDRAWRIGQTRTVVAHRLVCPGTVDERVEEVVAGKRRIANLVLPKSSSVGDLDADQLRVALGLDTSQLLTEESMEGAA